jgi:tetratricopeptide (TPR) repeat protein
VIANVNSWQFSEHEFMQLLIKKSNIYRDMGLYSKAISTIADKAEYVSDKSLKSQMFYEIAMCKIAAGDLNSAYNTLADTIQICEPGELNDRITISFADICLKLNRPKQARKLCDGLIKNSSSKEIKMQARKIIAEVYRRENNFDKAALALLGDAQKNEKNEN